MTPDELDTIRARDADDRYNFSQAYVDRRALLAEVDRLRDQLARHRAFGGHVDATLAERARIRAAVERLDGYHVTIDREYVEFPYEPGGLKVFEVPPAAVTITSVPGGKGLVNRAAVLAVIDGGK